MAENSRRACSFREAVAAVPGRSLEAGGTPTFYHVAPVKTLARLVVVGVLLAGVALIASSLGGSRTPAPDSFPQTGATPSVPLPESCAPIPGPIARPGFFPSDLPLPAGSYPTDKLEGQGAPRVVFVVEASLRDFVKYLLAEWPKAGWEVGRGESEPGEAESSFRKDQRYGVFRARAVFCDQGRTEVLFAFGTLPTPSPS